MVSTVTAMHMSDGLVNIPTAAVFGAVAAVGLALAVSRARRDLDDRTARWPGSSRRSCSPSK